MRCARFSPVRLAPLLAILLGPSCFSLPKAEVIRVLDDFSGDAGVEDAGFTPTWNVFGPWACGRYVDSNQAGDGGQDAGPDGGLASDNDGGQAVSCTLAIGTDDTDLALPPSTVTRTLVATFDLTTPSSSSVEVITRSKPNAIGDAGKAPAPPSTVNFTGFSQLIFNARLLPSRTVPLPSGTELHVEFHCSSAKYPLLDQDISTLTAGVVSWKTIVLPFSDFKVAAQRDACFATVESVAFIVVPGSAPPGTEVGGVLQIDEIRLQ